MAEETLPEEAKPPELEYPLSMRQVLFSFKGRISRREYWMKGFIPIWLFAIVFSALISGTAYYTSGTWLFKLHVEYMVRPGSLKPLLAFKRDGKNIIAEVNGLDTGAARANAEIVFDQKTKLLIRNYLVGTQHLIVTTSSKPTQNDPNNYDVQLRWLQYPVPIPQPPATLLVKVLTIALGVFYFLLLWPYAALLAKRGHDWGKNGWWALLLIVPFINIVWLIVLGVVKGTDGEYLLGPNPLDSD